MRKTYVEFASDTSTLKDLGRTAVSLHCHSVYSKEMLDFLPFYAEKMPVISHFYRREQQKWALKEQGGISFESAYWSPPMTPQRVYDSETKTLNDAGLNALVSITDHDEISGCFEVSDPDRTVPVSLEWTVPFGIGFFHVGVHNLPAPQAAQISESLLAYTSLPQLDSPDQLNALFEMLNELPEVLIVLNHPLWDIEMIGAAKHSELLQQFIEIHGDWLHALEVNGFRTWSENKAVLGLADQLGMPVVSGGDRHGCKNNTVINITDCKKFDEFVSEIRCDKHSRVVLLPEYEQPLISRQMASMAEILATYPDFPEGRRRWFDRVFFDINDGRGVIPLSSHGWKNGGPSWLRLSIKLLGSLGNPRLLPLFRMIRNRNDRVPEAYGPMKTLLPVPSGRLRSKVA